MGWFFKERDVIKFHLEGDMKKGEYSKLIDCNKPEEVLEKVKKFSSSLSNDEHIIRSIILDIHASVEMSMKQTLYHHMLSITFKEANGKINEETTEKISDTISKMSFYRVYELLEPCFKAFPHGDLRHIIDINNVRNKTAHGDIDNVRYKGRNPFRDFDCLAQIFVDSFAAEKALSKFFERMIDDPKALFEIYKEEYEKQVAKKR